MSLLDVVLPPSCAGCGRFGTAVCADCVARFRPPSEPADRFFAADAGVLVGAALRLARCAFAYEGVLRRALQRLKYGGSARVAGPLARAALPAFRGLAAESGVVPLVPVPLHPLRERERGYNQAALLARELAASSPLCVADLLRRDRPTVKQHKLDRVGRLRNLAGAFAVVDGARAPPSVIVVDDIVTTSATLESCASVLQQAGVETVYGFAIAREV